MANNPYQSYANTQAMTASPGELTLMLYNGAIRFLKQSLNALSQQDLNESNRYLQRAQDIILELMSTLNMDYPIAQNLMQLYDFMNRQLIEANLHKDEKPVQDVLELVEDLRESWVQALKQSRGEAVALVR